MQGVSPELKFALSYVNIPLLNDHPPHYSRTPRPGRMHCALSPHFLSEVDEHDGDDCAQAVDGVGG